MMNPVQLARTDINLLVLFDVVYQERHLGRAAQRLNLTASAISHALARLRRTLKDPLFLRTARGVTPTARASDLAAPIADILARVGTVMSSAEPFVARKSRRRFVIGAPDAIAAVCLPALMQHLRARAPHIDLAVRDPLAEPGLMTMDRAWAAVRAQLEARTLDIAVMPLPARVPPQFARRQLHSTDFVIAARRGHPFLRRPTLERYCELGHVLVSSVGDPVGFVDTLLAKQKRARRVAVTVPNFMLALSMVSRSDLLVAAPRNLIVMHSKQFGLQLAEPPLALPKPEPVYAVTTQAALLDAGVAWMFQAFE